MRFQQVKAPIRAELTRLTHTIAHRVGRYLERQGLIERDAGNIFLSQEAVDTSDEDPTNQLLGSSVTYRIAVGPQQGRKVFTLQTLPDLDTDSPFHAQPVKLPVSRCMPGLPPKPMSEPSWNDCAVISPDRQYPQNAFQ